MSYRHSTIAVQGSVYGANVNVTIGGATAFFAICNVVYPHRLIMTIIHIISLHNLTNSDRLIVKN